MKQTDDFADLYQEVILDHGRNPRHGKRLAAFDVTAKGDNPMCGDRVQVWVKLDNDAIGAIGFEARGCAISIASADLMVEAVAPDDGLIEAVAAHPCGGDVLAVQWHPEWDADVTSSSRAFFHLIGRSIRGDRVIYPASSITESRSSTLPVAKAVNSSPIA